MSKSSKIVVGTVAASAALAVLIVLSYVFGTAG
jgi:hypothetical protein